MPWNFDYSLAYKAIHVIFPLPAVQQHRTAVQKLVQHRNASQKIVQQQSDH